MNREATMTFHINVGENGLPNSIDWEASESSFRGRRGCDALFISMWDRLDFNTYNVNLYTGKLPKSELNFHFFKTFLSLADTYESATGKKDIAEMIRNFSEEFGKKLDILDEE